MSETLGTAVLTLTTDRKQFKAELANAKKDVQDLKGTFGDAMKSLSQQGKSLEGLGKKMSIGITAPLLAIGAAALKTGTDFNASMANVATLIPGNTARVTELKKAVQDMAIATGKSTEDLAGGLYQVVSAFGDTSETAKILEINARAAAAGVATTTDAINLTSAVTKGYGDTSAAAVQQVSDLAFQTVKLGQTTFPELASSISRVTPLAAELGVKQTELFGVMATFTGVTGGAAEVSTQLRGVLQSLLSPTEDMKGLLKAVGVESGKALIEQRGLQGAMELVVKTVKSSGGDLQKYLGSIEGQTLALSAAGSQSQAFTDKLGLMSKAQGASEEAFKEQAEGVNAAGFAWSQFKQEVIVASQELGDVLIPIVLDAVREMRPLFDVVKSAVTSFKDWPAPMKTAGVAVLGLVALLGPAIGGLGWAMGAITAAAPVMTAALAFATGPIGLIALAVTGLAAAVLIFDNNMRNAVDQSKRRSTALTKEGKEVERVAQAARELDAANKPLVNGTTLVVQAFANATEGAKKTGAAIKVLSKEEIKEAEKAAKELEKIRGENIEIEAKQRSEAWTARAKLSDEAYEAELLRLGQQHDDEQDAREANRQIETEQRAAAYLTWAKMQDFNGEREMNRLAELDKKKVEMMRSLGVRLKQGLASSLDGLSDIFKDAFTGGGGLLGGLKALAVDIGEQVGLAFSTAMKDSIKLNVAKGENGKAVGSGLTGRGVAAAGGMGALSGVGTMAAGGSAKAAIGSVATTAIGVGMSAAALGATTTAAVALGAATLGIGAAAVGAFVGFKKLFSMMGTGGRDAVREFAASMGGFDPLQKKLSELGTEGERLWIRLTQGVGRNNPEQAKAAIEEVNAALQAHAEKLEAARQQIIDVNLAHQNLAERMRGVMLITPELELALQKTYDPANPEEYLAAIAEINGILDQQAAKQQFLEQTMQKYGIAWTQLGEAARQAKVAELTQDIQKEVEILVESGVNLGDVMSKVGPHINDIVKEARDSKTEVPESFRKIIQSAIDAGQIFDNDKKKITDMKDAGVVFGTTMEEKMTTAADRMGTAIERLVTAIETRLGPAITNIPDGSFTVRGQYVPPKGVPGMDATPEIEGAAGGVFGDGTRPLVRVFAEGGEPELGGPVRFMKKALAGALASFEHLGPLLKRGLPSLAPNMAALAPTVTPSAVAAAAGGEAKRQQLLNINVDGRYLAHLLVPHLPDAVEVYVGT